MATRPAFLHYFFSFQTVPNINQREKSCPFIIFVIFYSKIYWTLPFLNWEIFLPSYYYYEITYAVSYMCNINN